MPDCYPKEVRSMVMSRIRSVDTKAEILLRKRLWARGYRGYRVNSSDLPGKPDIIFTKKKVAIFVDGCFWHKCPKCFVKPKSNEIYWESKIQRNVERDKSNTAALKQMNWKVIRVWEHEIKEDLDECIKKVIELFNGE